MSYGIGFRCSLDLALMWLWLWYRLVATALIQPLAWEFQYDAGAALKIKTKQNKKPQNIIMTSSYEFIFFIFYTPEKKDSQITLLSGYPEL